MGNGVRRIVPLTLGWEDLPKSVSVEGAPAERLREPVPAVLLECDGGWLPTRTCLLDQLQRASQPHRVFLARTGPSLEAESP